MSDSGRINDCCGHTVGHARNCRDAEISALKAKLDAAGKAVQILRDLQPFLAVVPREIFGTGTTEYGEYSWPVVAEFESNIVRVLAIIDGTTPSNSMELDHSENVLMMVEEGSDAD